MKRISLIFALVLAVAAGVLALRMRNGVETDLYSLADSGASGVLGDIAKSLAGQGRVLLEGLDFESLKTEAVRVREALNQKPAADFKDALKFLDAHKTGLLAPDTREMLLAGRYKDVADGALARLFSPAPRLLSVKDDPFLLATEFVTTLQTTLAEDWSLKDGFVTCERDGQVYILLTLDLAGVPPDKLASFVARSGEINKNEELRIKNDSVIGCEMPRGILPNPRGDSIIKNQLTNKPINLYLAGAPFHSAVATERSKREIGVLSGVSLVCVLALGWLLFRSFRFLPMLLLAQGAGFLVATGALFAVYERPHVLTFVFGTSLIGLSVDYVYHAKAAGDVRKIMRPLTLSLLTTIACFAPILFAEVVVLRQMAIFSVVGLLAAYCSVVCCKIKNEELRITDCGMFRGTPLRGNPTPDTEHPTPNTQHLTPNIKHPTPNTQHPTPNTQHPTPNTQLTKIKRAAVILTTICLAAGVFRARLVSDPAKFYKPDEYLAMSEKKLAQVSPGNAQRFAFVPGATLQEALEREEASGIKGLSAVIPSLKRQRENAALKAKLAAAEGARYAAQTGLKMPESESGDFLDAGKISDGPLADMVRAMWIGGGLVSPFPGDAAVPSGIEVLNPREALENLFARFTSATLKLLAFSFAAFVVMLAIVFRRRMLRYLLPVAVSLAATAGVLGWIGIPFTFFTLLCFFVLAGLGIDYVIFRACDSSPQTRRTVSFSFLTSFVGLGILAFTGFPVTQMMGITFATGLAFAWAGAVLLVPGS